MAIESTGLFISHCMAFMNPVDLIQIYCLVSIVTICIARLVPVTQERLLGYGARGQPPMSMKGNSNATSKVLDAIAAIDVPHRWFCHFYVLSFSSSLFWLVQIVSRGRLLRLVDNVVPPRPAVTPVEGSLLSVFLMLLHSARRLVESCTFSYRSTSRMWIGHYAFGLTFYLAVNLATWVEGVRPLLVDDMSHLDWIDFLTQSKIIVGLMLFWTASLLQHVAHAHLAALPKYSVPHHWLFKRLIAPHYTAECVLYLGLSMIAAPDGHMANTLLLWVVLLSAVNLGITADGTKKWLLQKFREQKSEIQSRYRLVPGLW